MFRESGLDSHLVVFLRYRSVCGMNNERLVGFLAGRVSHTGKTN
jgi:hypothetical protein